MSPDHGRLLDSTARNLRYATRALARTPAFTAAVVLMLALGIGANSAVFSAIDAILLRPLPFPRADRLVELSQLHPTMTQRFVAPVRLQEWQRLNKTFQAISGYYVEDVSELSGELPEKLTRAVVAPRFFQVWGVLPALGRDFFEQEYRFGGPRAVVISHRFWLRRFGGSPSAVGKTVRLGQAAFTIVGVMPRTFLFPVRDTDLWVPTPMDAAYAQGRELTWFLAVGRLKPQMSVDQARADLAVVQAGLGRDYPKTDALLTADVQWLQEVTVGGVRRSMWILFGSVSLLLVIACSNIGALLLSRASSRRHEIAVRASLGATRSAMVGQLLTEVFVLAFAGATIGLLVAAAAGRVFRALAHSLPRVDEVAVDWRIALYSFTCAVGVTLLCGLAPALRATRRDALGALAHASRAHVTGRQPVQFALVGVQVALAAMLLVGAGLLARSFQELGRVSPGFDADHVLTFHLTTTWGESSEPQSSRQRAERVLEAIRSLPGVQAAAVTTSLPGVPDEYQVELRPTEGRAESEPKMLAQGRGVSPDYFATMRMQLFAGETCRPEAATTVMVNRRFADVYYPGGSPIGRRVVFESDQRAEPLEIRGVVGNARDGGLDREPVPTIYVCSALHQPNTFFLVRTANDPSAMAETIRRRLREIEPRRSVHGLVPLVDHIGDTQAETRLRTILLTFFALTALSLACIGLYGTLSYLVNVSRREIALRLALGAGRTQVLRQVLLRGLAVSAGGLVAGLSLAAASGRVLTGMLYGVSTFDPTTVTGVVAILLAVSVAACVIPAVRASRLDPMRVLRES